MYYANTGHRAIHADRASGRPRDDKQRLCRCFQHATCIQFAYVAQCRSPPVGHRAFRVPSGHQRAMARDTPGLTALGAVPESRTKRMRRNEHAVDKPCWASSLRANPVCRGRTRPKRILARVDHHSEVMSAAQEAHNASPRRAMSVGVECGNIALSHMHRPTRTQTRGNTRKPGVMSSLLR